MRAPLRPLEVFPEVFGTWKYRHYWSEVRQRAGGSRARKGRPLKNEVTFPFPVTECRLLVRARRIVKDQHTAIAIDGADLTAGHPADAAAYTR